MKLLLLAALLLGGCVVREVRATPGELEAGRAMLRAGRPARVKAIAEGAPMIATVAPNQQVTVALVGGGKLDLPLSAIMRECVDHEPEDNRLCELHGVDHVVLAKQRRVHEGVWATPIALGIVGSVVGGLIYMGHCASECTGWGRTTSQVGLGTLGLAVLYFISQHGIAR
jgi:hypothetical protein